MKRENSKLKLDVIALANTFAIIDLILHALFRLWVSVSPNFYEYIMSTFVAGLHLQVTDFDVNLTHIVLGTIFEASIFWILGASVALIYNKLAKS